MKHPVALIVLTFLSGAFFSYAVTHNVIPSMSGSPQWAITGSLILSIITALAVLHTILKEHK